MQKNNSEINSEVIAEAIDGINEINTDDDKPKKKEKKKITSYLFFTLFFKKLKEDKLYFLSFVITLVAILFFSITKVREAEGIYTNKDNNVVENNNPSTDTSLNEGKDVVVDILSYVGFYSKEVLLSSPLVLSDTCTVTSYDYVYQVKKDKTITKYLINDCIGTIKMWSSPMNYVTNSGAKYINANNINYLFSVNGLKEVDGDTYKLNDDISSLKVNNKLKTVTISFIDDNILIETLDNLFLVNSGEILFDLDQYKSIGGSLDKKVYKSSTKGQYNFIMFLNNEKVNCYTDLTSSTFVDGINYRIFSVKYNEDAKDFDEVKEVISRDKSAGCEVYNDDLELLKK